MECLPFKFDPQNEIEQWRHDSFYSKEPETLEWIRSFEKNSIFWDVGANIGIYSLYAAALGKALVITAFEPSRINCDRLKELAAQNNFDKVFISNLAFGKERKIIGWEDTDPRPGAAAGKIIEPTVNRFAYMTTIDNLIYVGMTKPNYIKIDVDGGEWDIIQGAVHTLDNQTVKGVLVEIDPAQTDRALLCELMRQKGFTQNNEFNAMDNHSRYRRAREGIPVENVVFTR